MTTILIADDEKNIRSSLSTTVRLGSTKPGQPVMLTPFQLA